MPLKEIKWFYTQSYPQNKWIEKNTFLVKLLSRIDSLRKLKIKVGILYFFMSKFLLFVIKLQFNIMTSSNDISNKSKGPELGSLKSGIKVIKKHLKTLDAKPGVYRMLDLNKNILYVGKAKNLKKRVGDYTRPNALTTRLVKMVAKTHSMAFITTHTEAEALLLEANLIKALKPKYNILLRDDKSFPYILLKNHQNWPQITKHRGVQKIKGAYFGPFASAQAVNGTLNTLQRVFLLRSCSDSIFRNRTRPCLLYQIKRCSAPCVGKISEDDYQELLDDTLAFLSGKNASVQKRMARDMQKASDDQEFEVAASLRDRLKALTNIQQHQGIYCQSIGNSDIVALFNKGGQSSIQVFFYRNGQNWGNRAYYPYHHKLETPDKILGAFIAQFYETIYTNIKPESKNLMEEAFSKRVGYKVGILTPQRGEKKALVQDAVYNAKAALMRKLAEAASQKKLLEEVMKTFNLEACPERIEVYDNSHISGTNALGGMIVVGPEGFQRNAYRKFNIKDKNISSGDDFAMMREVLKRRFSRLIEGNSPSNDKGAWPDLVLIDGGEGQLNAVQKTLTGLGLEKLPIVGISKGPDRNSGREKFHIKGRPAFTLPPDNAVLFFLQRLRDEAHRFAIGAHRARRRLNIHKSLLDQISGVGPKRKKSLLNYFGSAKAVEVAGLKDLEMVEGVSKSMAKTIYGFFHDQS